MTEKDYAPLSSACVRGLCDKLYEKRKFAGVEIEKMVKDFNDANNSSQIKKLIRVLGQDLMSSTNPNVKNGALMGLSSVAVGLGKSCTTVPNYIQNHSGILELPPSVKLMDSPIPWEDQVKDLDSKRNFSAYVTRGCVAHLSELLHPMAACVREGESRVRYLAAEALFNVLKIARGAALPHFPLVFDALARLAADPEPQVRQGAELLDRLVKDIVTESGELEVSALVPLLRERLYARGACARQFAAGWVAALDALPALPLLPHLRDLLDPLLHMLDEPHPEIRRMCEVQLNEFLRSIKKDPSQVDFQAMINILITHAQSPEELVQLTAISWIKEFVELAGRGMLPYASGVLCAALPCLAYSDDARRNIRETAATVNFLLTKLVAGVGEESGEDAGAGEERLQLEALVLVLTQLLRHSSVHTKVAALDWILHLYNTLPAQMPGHTEAVFGSVVGSLTDPADDVVRRALAVLAEICSCPARPAHPAHPGDVESSPYYYKFLRALLRLLAADDGLLEDRGAFIIRQLCVLLNAEDIYKALASILVEESNLRFAATMVDVLSTMLLTAAELHHLRLQLRRMDQPGSAELLRALYCCWCHSPVALLALCLLTHHYAHCNSLIATFGDLDITVDFLTEVDKLVQLIESPIFAYLRLELLGGAQSSALRGALFGLLMLLPQSDAFHALRHRLHCAPLQPCLPAPAPAPAPAPRLLDLQPLLADFQRVQEAHRRYRLLERPAPAPAPAPTHRHNT